MECHLAEGGALTCRGVSQRLHSGQCWSFATPCQPQHLADHRRLQRGREAVQVSKLLYVTVLLAIKVSKLWYFVLVAVQVSKPFIFICCLTCNNKSVLNNYLCRSRTEVEVDQSDICRNCIVFKLFFHYTLLLDHLSILLCGLQTQSSADRDHGGGGEQDVDLCGDEAPCR